MPRTLSRHRGLWLLMLLPLMFSFMGPPVSGAASSGEPCGVPEGDFGPDTTPDTPAPHQEWVADEGAQAAVRGIGRMLQGYGVSDKTGGDPALANGLVGVALDHVNQQVVLVVDERKIDRHALQARAERAASAATEARRAPRIRVVDACVDSTRLVEALEVLRERNWHPRAPLVTFAFMLDAHTSTYVVTMSEADHDVAQALVERVGSAVTIEYGEVSPDSGSRWPDAEPHWGGAHIQAQGFPNSDCSSGFTVNLPNGNVGSVTAGHCYNNGDELISGSEYFGRADGEYSAPTYDMIRIHPYGETYARKLHVDPCCPDVRTVIGHGPAGMGELVCKSGYAMKAICGLEVVNTSGQVCYTSSTCTTDLLVYTKNGETVGAGGDSGGPVYTRPNSSDAWIRGMHVASTGDAKTRGYAEKIENIKSHLGVTVVQN